MVGGDVWMSTRREQINSMLETIGEITLLRFEDEDWCNQHRMKKENVAKRAQQAKKLSVLVQMAFTVSVTLFLAISMTMTDSAYLQMLYVVFSGLVMWCFIYWVGEWTK
jgi:protein-S-isoprenylcysteine O-methyltransferase Ste14